MGTVRSENTRTGQPPARSASSAVSFTQCDSAMPAMSIEGDFGCAEDVVSRESPFLFLPSKPE